MNTHYFFRFFEKIYDQSAQSLCYKIFFIELIYMLYIPLDSEFEGLSYEGILFFSVFCENICSYDFGQSLSYKNFIIELIYMLYIPLHSEFEGLSYEHTLFF